MTDKERLARGLRISWPVNVERDVMTGCGARTYTTEHDGTTVCAVALDRFGGIVVARDSNGQRLGVCGLASALAAMAMDWPITVSAR